MEFSKDKLDLRNFFPFSTIAALIGTSLVASFICSYFLCIVVSVFTHISMDASYFVCFAILFILFLIYMIYDEICKDLTREINIQGNNIETAFTKLKADEAAFNKNMEMKANAFNIRKEEDLKMLNDLRVEKSKGFPSLAKAYSDYYALLDKKAEDQLLYKKHPAVGGAAKVKEEAARRRKAEYSSRIMTSKMEYLLQLFPYLEEYLDLEDEADDEIVIDNAYSEEERQDPVTWYMSREEWLKLPSYERNDKALKRYWSKKHRSSEIGRMYERYIGYLFEKDGCDVEYTGIEQGFEDLGRDLIATNRKTNAVSVIQCKYWAKYKKIRVAHINQLFGTVTQYKMKNANINVIPSFFTTTELDETAREFSRYLGIQVKESFLMDKNYPCIKCNISIRNGEKIYHLPFDQQYDNTKIIEEQSERYVSTCKEAEDLGFRRAFRWHPER